MTLITGALLPSCQVLRGQSRQPPPLNLISKLNQRVLLRSNIAVLSSSHWSLKLEVICERRELQKAFQRPTPATEYEEGREAFWKNYKRLRTDRLAREAAQLRELMTKC